MADGSSDASNKLIVREYYAPVLLGTIFATFLFGVNLNQFVSYLNVRQSDRWPAQATVAVIFTMCTLQLCFCIYSLWFFSVQNFGNYSALLTSFWAAVAAVGILMALIAASVQQYFIWRVKAVTQSWLLFSVLSLCSVTSGVMGLVSSCAKIDARDLIPLDVVLDMVQATLAIDVFINVMNAAFLLYYLLMHRTGFQRTDSVIRRLVITCVESPLLNALVSLVDLIIFRTTYPTNWSRIAAIPLGQVYALSILALFNSRASLRATWNGVTDFDVNQLDHRLGRPFTLSQPTEPVRVGVTVEQHAQVEVDPFAARVKSRSKRAKVCSAITGTNSIESVIKAHDEHEMTDFPLAMRALNADTAEMDEDKKVAAVA